MVHSVKTGKSVIQTSWDAQVVQSYISYFGTEDKPDVLFQFPHR